MARLSYATLFDQAKRIDRVTGWPDDLLKLTFEYQNDDSEVKYTYQKQPYSLFGNIAAKLAALAEDFAPAMLWGRPDKLDAKKRSLETIITENPGVLTCSTKGFGPQGEEYGTLYELLLGTDDDHIRDKNGETFVEMMKRLVIQHHGADIEKKQWNNRLGSFDEKAHVTRLKAAFDEVTAAFDQTKATTETELANDGKLQAAIIKFQTCLEPKGIITSGKNCIPQLWDYAGLFYNYEKYRAYDYDSPKNDLFCQKILGTIDRRSSAWGMQVLNKGVYYVDKSEAVVDRVDVSSLFSVSPDRPLRLGFNSFMSIFGVRAAGRWRSAADPVFFKLMSAGKNVRTTEPRSI